MASTHSSRFASVPAPSVIPDGTSAEIAESIRRHKLEAEQQRILENVCSELGIPTRLARRIRSNQRRKYTAKAKRRARLTEGETFTRDEIIRRDNATCYLCNRGGLKAHEIHIDHDIPLIRGGTHTAANVHVACSSCNLSKGTMTSSEYRATLRARVR